MNNNTRVILGMIAAGVAGVAIGMLLAPEKGSDIRKNITNSFDELGEKINDLVAAGKNRVTGVANEFKKDVDIIKNDAQTAVEHGKQVVS